MEKVILAVGIIGKTENLGLENTSAQVSTGQLVVDNWGATNEPGLYAIGDLVGAPWLAHKASHEGVICVERIAGVENVHPLDSSNIPGCTYSRPQVASVGLTQKLAEDAATRSVLDIFRSLVTVRQSLLVKWMVSSKLFLTRQPENYLGPT